jgi:hypothetical protein
MQRQARALPIIVLTLATFATPGIHPALGQQTILPPAALVLAHRLHFSGKPFVGNQRQGNFGPWLIWGKPDLYGSRRILSVGPAGAQGQFDYFVPSALPQTGGRASPPPVSKRKALQIAGAWLTRAGVAIPQGHIRIFHTHATTIGGTGLCCWRYPLDVVIFGGVASVYVAPSQQIVQVNLRPRGHYSGALRCHNQAHPDNRAVPLGVFCFSYAEMTSLMWNVTLGGHQPYLVGPGWFSQVAASRAKIDYPPYKVHLRPVSVGRYRVVYTVSKGAITYRFTQVPAFPELRRFSTWPLVEVQRIT